MSSQKPVEQVPTEQKEVDETIDNPEVANKYKLGASIVEEAIKLIAQNLKVGAKVQDLCALGDKFLLERTSSLFKKNKEMKKGIAFPTCINVNEIVCHCSPIPNTTEGNVTLKENDVVRVDLGVHVDGYPSLGAQTFVLSNNAVTGREADCLAAVQQGMDVALRLVKPGNTNTQLMAALEKVAETYGVKWCQGVLSHEIKRDVIDGNNVILLHPTPEQTVEEFTFTENQVFCLDLVATTESEGKLKESTARTTVYKRDPTVVVDLKVNASRKTYHEVSENFGALAFSINNLDQKTGRIGILELVNTRMVEPFPVLSVKKGEFVAQLKSTVLITKKQVQRLTGTPIQAYKSDKSLQDEELVKLLKTSLKIEKKEATMDVTE
ncbi:hypothetical protein ABK040_013706 [Willaertia magna]